MKTKLQLVSADLADAFRHQVRQQYRGRAQRNIEPWCSHVVAEFDKLRAANRPAHATVYGHVLRGYLVNDPAARYRAVNPMRFHASAWYRATLPVVDGGLPAAIYESHYEVAKARAVEVNLENVDADADRRVQEAIDFFNVRVGEKLVEVLGAEGAEDAEVAADLRFSGTIQGTLTAILGGKTHTWTINLITNYRYNENAANGTITAYWQVPCRYKGVA